MAALKDKTIKGVIWSAVDRFSAQGIQLFALVTLLSLVASMFIIRSEQNALFG